MHKIKTIARLIVEILKICFLAHFGRAWARLTMPVQNMATNLQVLWNYTSKPKTKPITQLIVEILKVLLFGNTLGMHEKVCHAHTLALGY